MTKFIGVIAVLALLLCVAIAKPVGDNAAEEVDADDLQPAAQFYPGYYNGGFGGFGGFGGYGGHGGYYPHHHHRHHGYGYGSGSFESGSFERGGYFG